MNSCYVQFITELCCNSVLVLPARYGIHGLVGFFHHFPGEIIDIENQWRESYT